MPVALVYMDFNCCVSARDIMSVLLEKSLRVKWDNHIEKFDTEYTGKSDEMILHTINKFPIRNRETVAKAAFSKMQDETVIVMYSIEHENFLPQPNTQKVDLYFSVMKILEHVDCTFLMFMLHSDEKLPPSSNTTKLKLAQLSQWLSKFSRAVHQFKKL
jgi:hypothetical protein